MEDANPFEQFVGQKANSAASNPFDQFMPPEQPGIVGRAVEAVKPWALMVGSKLNEGAARSDAGLATFLQAPAANTLAGVAGAAALAEKGLNYAAEWIAGDKPPEGYVSPIQEAARGTSAFAAEQRKENARNNPIASALGRVADAGRKEAADWQQFNRDLNPELVRQEQAINGAKGAWDTTKAIVKNPLGFGGNLAQSLPDMLSGALLAQGAAMLPAATEAQAVARASLASTLSEAASSASGAREGIYTSIASTPHAQLLDASPRYMELLAQGMEPKDAREKLANEVADSASLLTGTATATGSVVTNKMFGGDKTAEILAGRRITGRDVLRNMHQEGSEEALQGIGEDTVQHAAMLTADKGHQLDIGGSLVQNYAAGAAMGGPGTAGSYLNQTVADMKAGRADVKANPFDRFIKAVRPSEQPKGPAAVGSADARPADSGGVSFDYATYEQRRRMLESGGQADAKNPLSSATGVDQFTEDTWLNIVGQASPAWSRGMSRSDLLALRTDPQKSREMARALDRQNTQALQHAGVPVNYNTLYAAHHFGPVAAVKMAKAAPDDHVSQFLSGAQIQANPYLAKMTKADVLANWDRRAGGAGGSAMAPGAQASVQASGSIVPVADIQHDATQANDALLTPIELTDLDRVGDLNKEAADAERRLSDLAPEKGYGPTFDGERAELQQQIDDLRAERDALTRNWPRRTNGSPTSFTTETGARLEGRYALVESDSLVTSHDVNLRQNDAYPQALQPRARDRAASEMQISGIVGKLDPARLGLSADAATGAPIIGADGLVESGNARTIALQRVYQADGLKAREYRSYLQDHASEFGLASEDVAGMRNPVLVRVRDTPVNRAEFARQANASTVAAMSPSEQARADAQRITTMEDLAPDDNGDFQTSRDFIRRFMASLPATEQAAMVDSAGMLSTAGYSRVRNAVLAKAYGDSPVLQRMTESLDDNQRNISRALMMAAPDVAKMRAAIEGGVRFDVDIAPDLMAAVEELSRLKDDGVSVQQALSQAGMFGDKYSPETRALMQFLADNIRRPRRIAEFIQSYYQALDAAGDPNQGSLLGETESPAKGDMLNAAIKEGANNAESATAGLNFSQQNSPGIQGDQGAGRQDGKQPTDEAGNRQGDQGDGAPRSATESVAKKQEGPGTQDEQWVAFPADMGSMGIPRADMPQIKGDDRSAFLQFLRARGMDYAADTVPAADLKPTQAEFSATKIDRYIQRGFDHDRSVLVSKDAHVLDGHHQWLAHSIAGRDIPVIRIDAPMRDLLQAANEFPSVRRSEGAGNVVALQQRRADALADFKAAMADLADLATTWQRAAITPEQHAKLMPTLVRLFDSAIRMVGTDLKLATRWVQQQLRADKTTRKIVNLIEPMDYRKAAEQALAGQKDIQAGLFDSVEAANAAMQGDLFGAAVEAKHPAGETTTIDGKQYSLDAPNFGFKADPTPTPEHSSLLTPTDQIPVGTRVSFEGESVPRNVMREKIVEDFFAGVEPVRGRAPVAYVMGGGGASGKGAMKSMLARSGAISGNAVDIDADAIKQRIPEYVALVEARDSRAAAVVHEESSMLSKMVRKRAIEGKYDAILDVTLGDEAKGVKAIQELKDAGYEVRLFGVTIDPATAVIRAKLRAERSGRYVPIGELLKAHKGFNAAFERYAAVANSAQLWDTNDAPKMIALGKVGGVEVLDKLAYNQVAERSSIDAQATTLREIGGTAGRNGESAEAERLGRQGHAARDGIGGRHRSGEGQDGASTNRGVDSRGLRKDGLNANPETDLFAGAQGEGAGAVSPASSIRGTGQARERSRAGSERGNRGSGDGAVRQGRPEGAGGVQRDRSADPGGRAGRPVGVPPGRDIPVKSGRNYRFDGADDLTYKGSWAKKAEANVAAVELLHQLTKESRQATPEEQAILAKFVGWGASDLASNIFNDTKAAARELAATRYKRAMEVMDANNGAADLRKIGYGPYSAVYDAMPRDQRGVPTNGVRYGDIITADKLAKPSAEDARWTDLRNRLKTVMTEAEWKEAARTTQYGHYTSKAVVQSMWSAMERMGFKGGVILEPGAGIGVFPGLMPAAMAANSAYTGIEYDSFTGGVLKHLMPDERIVVDGYQDVKLPKDFYDVAIGNPPFASHAVLSDPEYRKQAFKLHDYFFAKTIDRVKPGGLVAFVTSRYTMDKVNDAARAYLAERADLVGAIRMPQTAFKQNAGTEVVTDVLFLRKKVPGETFEGGHAWSKSVSMKVGSESYAVNEYFHAHPEMVLGDHSSQGSMRAANEYTVKPRAGEDIEAAFAKAAQNLPSDVYRATSGSAAQAAQVREIDFNPSVKKEGNFYVTQAGVLMQREGGQGLRVERMTAKQEAIVKDYVPLRDALKQAQYDQLSGGAWEQSLGALKAAYDAFVAKHGRVLQFATRTVMETIEDPETGEKIKQKSERRVFPLQRLLSSDPDYSLVLALEKLNEETGAITESDALRKRVLDVPERPKVESAADALLTTLNDTGRVDMATVAQRIGMSEADAIEALGTAVYQDPGAGWQMADEYLSGNVKAKLEDARTAARSDKRFERNVTALEAVQPEPKTPSDINVGLGMNWVPATVYQQFLQDVAGIRSTVSYNAAAHKWNVELQSGWATPEATADWGTQRRNAGELVEAALSGRPVRITDTDPITKSSHVNESETEAANAKLAALRERFSEWVWENPERTDKLVQLYNDKFNTTVPRKFDGRHLTLPGTSKLFNVYDHVKRGAWRIIQTGNTYLAHAVGSGKTFQMVIAAMEQKRLGLVKKPMFVVPNHMLQQFAAEWMQLYPAARLMIADEENFSAENRRRFMSRVALSDLDGVIVTQSAFKLLDVSPEHKAKVIEEQLAYLQAAMDQADPGAGQQGRKPNRRDPTVKQIQQQIERLEQRLQAAMSDEGKDKNILFDQMGVDQLVVDEAHGYRKLDYATARQVKGIQPSGSAMALDLYTKVRYLESKNPGRSLVMASGTPITNTLAELYTVQRFMDMKGLEQRGLDDFDSWASQYGRESVELEPNAAGKYEPVARFTKFVNVGDLTMAFRQFADVLTSDDLAGVLGKNRPQVAGGGRKLVLTPKTQGYMQAQDQLRERMEASRKWRPTQDQPNNPDPVINIIGDGRLAAIDHRFLFPDAPSDPQSKLNQAADFIINRLNETADNTYLDKKTQQAEPAKGGTMMLFSDIGFGDGVAARRGFDGRKWLEQRLRDGGVDMKQVAFMSDFKKSQDKLALFRDVNAGRVRLLVGTSKNMGTGVNAQQRITDVIHLDPTWYPADIEQREGRGLRQGNKNKDVALTAFATKGSYDENMWKMIARKADFISQIMTGDGSVNEVEDVTGASDYAVLSAMVAENPKVLELAGAEADVKRLERLYQAHEQGRLNFRARHDSAATEMRLAEKALPKAEALASKAVDLSGDNFTAKVGSRAIGDRVKWGEALIQQYNDLAGRVTVGSTAVGSIGGFDVVFEGVSVKAGGNTAYNARLMLSTPEAITLVSSPGDPAAGIAMRAQNAVAAAARYPAKLRESIATNQAVMESVKDRISAPFPMAQMLTDARAEVARLTGELEAEGKAAEASHDAEQPPADDPKLARGLGSEAGAGVPLADLQALADRTAKALPNLPGVTVLQSVQDAPADLAAFIEREGGVAKGALHTDGRIYLFADHLSDMADAEHVLATHEANHAGLASLLGDDRRRTVQSLVNQNDALHQRAQAFARQHGVDAATAAEEVLVDMAPADLVKLRGWRKVTYRVANALAPTFPALARQLRTWLDGKLSDQQRADLAVADLMTAVRRQLEGKPPMMPNAGVALQADAAPAMSRAAGGRGLPRDVALVADFRNDEPLKRHPDYRAAKAGDTDAAARLVRDLVKLKTLERTREAFGPDVVFVPVHAEEAAGKNKIPNMLAMLHAEAAGASVWPGIMQANKAFHTGAGAMERLMNRAEFDGPVAPGRRYVLVDDVTTMGSTLADLAAYIQRNGGEVVGSVVLVNAARGGKMSAQDKTINQLEARHGQAIRDILGIAADQLTGPEADYLIGFRSADEIRNRAAKAGSDRVARLRSKEILSRRQAGLADPKLARTNASPANSKPTQRTADERAQDIIDTSAATPAPMDAVFKLATRLTGIEAAARVLGKVTGKALDRFTPEKVKAGIISDYGLPQDVTDQRALMQARKSVELRRTGGLLDRLANLTREESRIAYQWLNETDPVKVLRGMSELPEGSVEVLQEVQQLIDRLSRDAVDLGQLDAQAYERHKLAYLHRSYKKHVLEAQGGKAERARAISILGNQYKGRGLNDHVAMASVRQTLPEWWDIARTGKGDADLTGRKLVKMERRAGNGVGTGTLDGMDPKGPGRVLETAWLPADRALPAKYQEWANAGTWEVRGAKGDGLTVWRDYTQAEREHMGEIDEARFAIAKTLHGMIRDVENGRYLDWIARKYAKPDGSVIEGEVVDANEGRFDMLHAFKPGQWVQVPSTKVAGTNVTKYGKLAGKWVEGPIWNEVRQAINTKPAPFGETFAKVTNAWKLSKTALSPTVHTNNIMSNFVMADWHGVTAGHVAKALRVLMGAYGGGQGAIGTAGNLARAGIGMADREAAQAIVTRYKDSGAELGGWANNELQASQLDPLLQALEQELMADPNSVEAQAGVFSALQLAMKGKLGEAAEAAKNSKPGKVIGREAQNVIDLYQNEDAVFRLAAWLQAKERGASDIEAGRVARKAFMDYNINAPWVSFARATALPFVSYPYRAVPMLAHVATTQPHKLLKLMAIAGALNQLGSLLAGGADDDKVRSLMPEEKAGGVWGMVPKMIRMPWNDANGSPVFLDIRRWIPVGDVFDVGQGHAALPVLPMLMPSGPLAILGELLMNKSAFTGKEITKETDTAGEKSGKVLDHVYKSFAPNVLGLPGTYATQGVVDAANGRTDAFGREHSVGQAIASAVGVKVGSYPYDVLARNAAFKASGQGNEIAANIQQLRRQYATRAITREEFETEAARQQAKRAKVFEDLATRLRQ